MPTSKHTAGLDEALLAYQWGDLEAARSHFDALLAARPDDPVLPRMLATVLLELERPHDAVQQLERALARHAALANLWGLLARACLASGNAVYAEASARRALALDPGDTDGLLAIGTVLLERGRAAEARDLLVAADGGADHRYLLARLHEQCGDSGAALDCYARCLPGPGAKPHALAADAHNNSGLIHLRGGERDLARSHFEQALRLRPDFPEAHYNLGLCHKESGELELAEASYRRALASRPAYPDAMNNLGNLLLQRGDPVAAESMLRAVLEIDPAHALARANLAAILVQAERESEAEAVLGLDEHAAPDAAALLYSKALVLVRREQWDEAESVIAALRERMPGHLGAIELQARLHHQRHELNEAIRLLEPVLDQEPGCAERYSNMGAMYGQLGRFEDAVRMLEQALTLEPRLVGTRANLALAFKQQGRLEQAERILREGLELDDGARTGTALAVVVQAQGRHAEARQVLLSLLQKHPADPDLWCTLGNLHMETGDVEGGQQSYEKALSLKPDYTLARWNLSFCYLARGDFERGWEHYETRLSPDMPQSAYLLPRMPDVPLWRGEALDGKRILVVGEQGYGDILQCLRFLPVLAARGAQVSAFVRPALATVARQLGGVSEVHVEPPKDVFDFQVLTMSLPGILRASEQLIPGTIPYIHPPVSETSMWRDRLDAVAAGRPRIGLVWAGSPDHPNDRYRSIPETALAPLLVGADVCWIGLNPASHSAQVAGHPIHPFGRDCGDFLASAALVAALDLVITVDTSVAHLAGAMGAPCWVLLAANPDWRWLRGREDSPWYPSLRLFRQQTLGEWASVLEQVRNALSAFVAQQSRKGVLP